MARASRAYRAESQPRRGLRREEAAAYICISPSKFDQMVKAGELPKPLNVGGVPVFDIRKIDVIVFGDVPVADNDNEWDGV